MERRLTRRSLLSAGSAGIALTRSTLRGATKLPTAPVAVARQPEYGAQILPVLDRMFDQLGGVGRLVKGKTVSIKLNLTGNADARMGYIPPGCAQWVHPDVVAATVHLLGRAGARRIRLLESPWSTPEPLEEFMIRAEWDPSLFLSSADRVEFVNTNYLGRTKRYSRFMTPGGGYMFAGYDMHQAFEDCDVFVSLAKLKESPSAGITLSIKNSFGNLPATIYGNGSKEEEPSRLPMGGRTIMHNGSRQPSGWQENDPSSPRVAGYRIPRVITDVAAARPIDLAVIDGIESITRGPTPRRNNIHVKPGLLVAGTNCVTLDTVGTALMGFDPYATNGTPPFDRCDNTLELAENIGLGTRDLSQIEVTGDRIKDSIFDFRKADPR